MKLNKRINENEKLNAYIKNEIISNKNLYMGKGINTKLILKNRKKFINNFMSRNKGLQTEYNELKSENQKFSYVYKKILDYRDNQTFLEKKFKDNLILYQKKGYRTPNLTTKSNIIKYSPLIMMGQEHINKFYLQDLYILNKSLKKVWPYDKLEKYIKEKDISFNDDSDNNDDENEKEGINSQYFLNKCDLLVKNAFKQKKENRTSKSLDVSNWFKHDLYADPFLTQGNKITYNDNNYIDVSNEQDNIKINKAALLTKKIENLKAENKKIKNMIHRIKSFDEFKEEDDLVGKRRSLFSMRHSRKNTKYSLTVNDLNLEKRSRDKKLTLQQKTRLKKKFEEYYNNIINSKLKEQKKEETNLLILENRDKEKEEKKEKAIKQLLKAKTIKHNYENKLKKNKNINISENNYISKESTKNIIRRVINEKRFDLYSGKDAKYLFSLINDIKEPFLKKSILNIYKRTFKISKLDNVNTKYSLLDKNLYQGLVSVDLY